MSEIIIPTTDQSRHEKYVALFDQAVRDFGMPAEWGPGMLEDAERQIAEYLDGGYPPGHALWANLFICAHIGRACHMDKEAFDRMVKDWLPRFYEICGYGVQHGDNALEDQKNGFKQKLNG